MSLLTDVITARDAETRNRSLDALCRTAHARKTVLECEALDEFLHGAQRFSAQALVHPPLRKFGIWNLACGPAVL